MNANELGEGLLVLLEERGWRVERSASLEPLLPPPLRRRYPRLPVELTCFLEGLERCVNPFENVWFLCREDYRPTNEESFAWNGQELISLGAVEGDPAAEAEIRRFWDHHFPFMQAVHSDYDYLAVSLEEQSFGEVVHGFALEFEEASTIAPSFTELLAMFKVAAAADEVDYPLDIFIERRNRTMS